jgi:hypothetical protein
MKRITYEKFEDLCARLRVVCDAIRQLEERPSHLRSDDNKAVLRDLRDERLCLRRQVQSHAEKPLQLDMFEFPTVTVEVPCPIDFKDEKLPLNVSGENATF